MKIIIFGCQQITVDFIKYLLTIKEVKIPLVMTSELMQDALYGYESVVENFKDQLHVKNTKNITAEILQEIESIQPDIIFSLYYRHIFPEKLLSIPRIGCVNIHPSLLPKYRGPAPTAWSILNNESTTGVTIHYMDAGIDTGDILIQEKIDIHPDETGFELNNKVMTLATHLLIKNFHNIIQKKIVPTAQTKSGSYFGKKEARCVINWKQRAIDIKNMIRVHALPYNRAETMLLNHHVLINKVEMVDYDAQIQKPGRIMEILENEQLIISCADGYLLLKEYEVFPRFSASEKQIFLRKGHFFN